MIRSVFEKLIKKRNPNFSLSDNITNRIIFQQAFHLLKCKIRGIIVPAFHFSSFPMLFLEQKVSFYYIQNITIGKHVIVEKYTSLSALAPHSLQIGDNVRIGAFSNIHVCRNFKDIDGFIRLGDNVGIGEYCYLGGAGGLEIGDNTIVGQYFSCHPEDHNFACRDKLIRDQGVRRKGIVIGKNCWIGSKVTVLDGTNIGDGCVLAAGAVIKGDFPDHCVIGGCPAKIIKYVE